MKKENWNGYCIRFVEKNGEWWAVLKDVCDALGLKTYDVSRRIRDMVSTHNLETLGGKQEMLIVNEFGVYDTVFQSRKPEAKEFRCWVYEMLKELRQATGLEGFEVFRMLDKEHQKEAMKRLQESLKRPSQVDYIKANTIANKAVSKKYGYSKMLKKTEMTPNMLVERENFLDDTVELMGVNDKFQLGISVSEQIYKKCI